MNLPFPGEPSTVGYLAFGQLLLIEVSAVDHSKERLPCRHAGRRN